jgi:hypothetical protein
MLATNNVRGFADYVDNTQRQLKEQSVTSATLCILEAGRK